MSKRKDILHKTQLKRFACLVEHETVTKLLGSQNIVYYRLPSLSEYDYMALRRERQHVDIKNDSASILAGYDIYGPAIVFRVKIDKEKDWLVKDEIITEFMIDDVECGELQNKLVTTEFNKQKFEDYMQLVNERTGQNFVPDARGSQVGLVLKRGNATEVHSVVDKQGFIYKTKTGSTFQLFRDSNVYRSVFRHGKRVLALKKFQYAVRGHLDDFQSCLTSDGKLIQREHDIYVPPLVHEKCYWKLRIKMPNVKKQRNLLKLRPQYLTMKELYECKFFDEFEMESVKNHCNEFTQIGATFEFLSNLGKNTWTIFVTRIAEEDYTKFSKTYQEKLKSMLLKPGGETTDPIGLPTKKLRDINCRYADLK
ncbi:MAG: hypothetical protein CMJ08_05900 [Pelagibacterales bacterium]|nr:hypothetical protein [Pelagibacterales bacterium]|tara:strand:+ start:104 stop:1204 length:1101 start_codon:yes stop_codon:yes gene_type:complete